MLREKLKNHTIILASSSPRRQQFFKELDLDFVIQIKEVEEIYPKELEGTEITDFLDKFVKGFDFKSAKKSVISVPCNSFG